MSEQNKIDEIKAALAAATPGPWISHEDSVCSDKGAWVCQMFEGDETIGDEVEPFENDYNNAEFIARAPEYITYLLQLVDELNGALDEPKKNLLFQMHNERIKKYEVIRERNELLRKIERKDEALRTMAESPDEWYVGRTSMREYARQALEAL